MQTVASIISGKKVGERHRVAHYSVKIDHRVELAACPYPRVDGLADGLVGCSIIGMAAKGRDRRSVGTEVSHVRLIHKLPIGVGQALGAGAAADIINPLKEDQP